MVEKMEIMINKKGKMYFPTRTCPECETENLEVSAEDDNKFECNLCGSIWQRLKPLNKNGKMTDMPKKLKEFLKK